MAISGVARTGELDSSSRFDGIKRVGARIIREPLLHFLILGGVIFWIGTRQDTASSQYRIALDRTRIAQIAQTYAQQFGGPPSPTMLRSLVDNYLNEEILYREGLAMGLDKDDQVIRRRIVQKVQFLVQDLNPPAVPADSELRAFYESHRGLYMAPKKVAFSHIYFSPDKGGDAKARAIAVLATLKSNQNRAPERGDPYPDLYDYASIGPQEATKLFGDSPMATAIFRATPGKWSGPFRSGYGWHLVYISAVEPSHAEPFERARAKVGSDYQARAQNAINQRNFASLKARYTISRADDTP